MKTKVKNSSLNDSDILAMYLKEINKIPLLTREGEEDLSRRMFNCDEEAKEKLIKANLRFVVSIARKYKVPRIPLVDLINEGNLGLIQSTEKFDYTKGFHFISYAVWWIRQSILKFIAEKSRMIRLPLNKVNDLRKIENNVSDLSNKYKRSPTISEIADNVDLKNEDINHLMNISQNYLSLESTIGNDNDRAYSEIIADQNAVHPEEFAFAEALVGSIDEMLEILNEREHRIIILRFGLKDQPRLSLMEIGKMYGLSKERIRQIEKRAIEKLRDCSRSQRLKSYIT